MKDLNDPDDYWEMVEDSLSQDLLLDEEIEFNFDLIAFGFTSDEIDLLSDDIETLKEELTEIPYELHDSYIKDYLQPFLDDFFDDERLEQMKQGA